MIRAALLTPVLLGALLASVLTKHASVNSQKSDSVRNRYQEIQSHALGMFSLQPGAYDGLTNYRVSH